MRTRTTVTGAFDVLNPRYYRKRSSCTSSFGPDTFLYNNPSGVVVTKTISDVQTPGFRALKRCGVTLPLNPVTITTSTEERISGGDCNLTVRTPKTCVNVTQENWGSLGRVVFDRSFSIPDLDIPESAIVSAVNSAVADARSASWDLLTFLGEGRETISLFHNAVLRVRHFAERAHLRALKLSKGKTKAYIQWFSDLWLEYRYGWRPAVYDLNDAIAAFTRKRTGLVRGRGSVPISFADTKSWTEALDSANNGTFVEQYSCDGVVRGFAIADIRDSNAAFGVDPLSTAWELLRFSFIIDWLIDVGTWISAISPFQPGSVVASMGSIRLTTVRTLTGSCLWHDTSTSSYVGGGVMGTRRVTTESYQRFPYTVSLPGFNPRLSPAKVLDLLTILIGLKHRTRPPVKVV